MLVSVRVVFVHEKNEPGYFFVLSIIITHSHILIRDPCHNDLLIMSSLSHASFNAMHT